MLTSGSHPENFVAFYVRRFTQLVANTIEQALSAIKYEDIALILCI